MQTTTTSDLPSESFFDISLSRMSRVLAARSPRRSFIGRVGRLTVAAGAGAVGTILWADPALAARCWNGSNSCNGATESAICGCRTSGTGGCPSGTCECGCWNACTKFCNAVLTQLCDCCQSGTPTCACSPGRPKFCFPKEWSGGCGTVGSTVIRCRTPKACVGPRACV